MTNSDLTNVSNLCNQFSTMLVARNIIRDDNVDAAVIVTRDVLKAMFTSDGWAVLRNAFKAGDLSATEFLDAGMSAVADRLGVAG